MQTVASQELTRHTRHDNVTHPRQRTIDDNYNAITLL